MATCNSFNRKSINFTFEESVEKSNLLLKVTVPCVLQLGALEVLARVKDVLDFVESSILVYEQQKRLQTLERGGGAACLQDEAPLRHEHAALAINTNANCQLLVLKINVLNDMRIDVILNAHTIQKISIAPQN